MLTMLQTQVQTLGAMFQVEMSRYTEQDKQPRGE